MSARRVRLRTPLTREDRVNIGQTLLDFCEDLEVAIGVPVAKKSPINAGLKEMPGKAEDVKAARNKSKQVLSNKSIINYK